MSRAGLDTDAVVQAACTLADRDGLQELTLARLAAELGIRPPSLYVHVAGLDDLRRRIGAHGAEALTAALQAAATGRAGADALHAVADTYRAFALRHPGQYAALQVPQEADPTAQALVETVIAVLRGYRLEGDDALHAVRIVRSALHGFVMLETSGGFGIPLDLDESFSRLVSSLDRGLRARS